MPRIRTIKPEILIDEKTACLSNAQWRLFVSCFVLADDYGNLRAGYELLHSQVFWGSETTKAESRDSLDTLARLSLLGIYEVHGQRYAHIMGWDKHQKVDHPGKPSCPKPTEFISFTEDSRNSRETLAKVPETLAPDLGPKEEDQEEDSSELFADEQAHEQPEPALLTFPCAKGETWNLTESIRREIAEAYPAVDVLSCARRALEWCKANPRRVKTSGRMRGWLGSVWCAKAQDSGGTQPIRQHRPQQTAWMPPEI